MRKILQRNEKVELNSFIDEFVKARQKYFTPGQEWLEAELAEEKISVYMDKAQLEKDLDELVKTSLMYGKVRNLEMKIQVKRLQMVLESVSRIMVLETGEIRASV